MSKKKQKSIEELLEEALVPEEEQLYQVPENWVWVKAGYITDIVGGGTPKTTVKEYYENGDIPWITPADLSNFEDIYISRGQRNITKEGLKNSSAKLLPEKTVLLSSRAPIGYVAIAANPLSTNQGFKSFIPSNAIDSEYLYWYLMRSRKYLESMGSGSTFKEISASKCKEIKIPLSPLNEQKRIAEKVERLFGKIDEAKRLIEEVKESFELRRAAILDKAFKGQLGTNDPNEESMFKTSNDIKEKDLIPKEEQPYGVPENWIWVKLGSLAEVKRGASPRPKGDPKYFGGNIPWLKISDVTKQGKYIYTTEDTVTEAGKEKSVWVEPDTLILSISASVGRPCINKVGVCIHDGFVKIVENEKYVDKDYLYYYLLNALDQILSRAKGATQININSNIVRDLPVTLPPLSEQRRIAEKVEILLDKLEDEKERVLEVEEKLQLLKQSILNKAFRGELGTNDPTDEHAIELLKEVLKSKSK
jgi:type I restriction enzyme, S subunit